MSDEDPVRLEVRDGIAHLTLDRPDVANSIDRSLARAFEAAAATLTRTPGVRAVLLSGAGDRFCGGGDVTSFAGLDDELGAELGAILAHLHPGIEALVALDAPVIAAVQGSAAGAGLALVAGADLVVAGASTRFVLAYSALGLTPDAGASWYLPRLIGLRRAAELLLTNRMLDADEALAWGLVNRVVPDADVAAEALALATAIADGPTRAYGSGLRMLRSAFDAPLGEHLAREAAEIVAAGGTADGVEGVAAFVEKRPPGFRGH